MEAELGEGLGEPGAREVVGDDTRPRGKRGLYPRLWPQALVDGAPGEQACRHHHVRIRGVGAARDGGDDDVAVVDDLGPPSHLGPHRPPDARQLAWASTTAFRWQPLQQRVGGANRGHPSHGRRWVARREGLRRGFLWAVAGHLGEHQVLDAGSGYGFRLEASQRNTKGPACA